ncbi:hypothetical protein ACFSYG_16565 [Leeuwenhoekiella polynyae]|uniref:hypothetical protein n=1 Tax=Leeuwenhoekiella polynyae TaxID=1550906 RepID=UPI00363AAC47
MNLKLSIIALLFMFIGCDTENETQNESEALLNGNWQNTEAFISSGGPQYWIEIEDGEEIQFLSNGTFSSNRYTECTRGTFSIEDSTLTLKYVCPDFEPTAANEDGLITYSIAYESKTFLLTPTSGPICTEGCSYKYQKVNYLGASLSADKGRPTRHSLETNFQFRGKPRGIKPFGGANKIIKIIQSSKS